MLTDMSPSGTLVLASLERRVPKQTFDTWFRPLSVKASNSERVLRFSAPNTIVKEWVVSHYSDLIEDSLRELSLDQYRVEWSLAQLPHDSSPHRSQTMSAPIAAGRSAEPTVREEGEAIPFIEAIPSSLNEKYTFPNFVVASCNRFAHAAAKAVAESPGQTYNPLYLYGGVGLGKTHLIQATGHAIKTARPELQIAYLSLERFMNELINAIRYGYDKTRLFRERYRSIDVLLIDDVQFIAGKERTQEEFFHTFNALYDRQRQIVLTSDCPPREIPEIEERLHSRFEWGLIADIEPPD